MADVLNFSEEYKNYRQRVALVYKALFENEFLENYYIILQELFNGNYLMSDLRKAVEKNSKGLFGGKRLMRPIIKKENASRFTDSIEKSFVLLFLVGELFFEIEENIQNETFDLSNKLTILSDTLKTMESERNIYLSTIGASGLKNKEIEKVNIQLVEMDNIFVKKCRQIKEYLQSQIEKNDNMIERDIEFSNDIINVVSSIIQERELEKKVLRKEDIGLMR